MVPPLVATQAPTPTAMRLRQALKIIRQAHRRPRGKRAHYPTAFLYLRAMRRWRRSARRRAYHGAFAPGYPW